MDLYYRIHYSISKGRFGYLHDWYWADDGFPDDLSNPELRLATMLEF